VQAHCQGCCASLDRAADAAGCRAEKSRALAVDSISIERVSAEPQELSSAEGAMAPARVSRLLRPSVTVLICVEVNAEMEHQTAMDTTTEGSSKPMGQRGAEASTCSTPGAHSAAGWGRQTSAGCRLIVYNGGSSLCGRSASLQQACAIPEVFCASDGSRDRGRF
jgi:hypothetical protein